MTHPVMVISSPKKVLLKGSLWVTLEKILTFVFSFASGIILSRLLTPADFGLYAFYLSIIVVIFRLFNIGISSEIMHLDTKNTDYSSLLSSLFALNFAISLFSLGIVALIDLIFQISKDNYVYLFYGIALKEFIANLSLPYRATINKKIDYFKLFGINTFQVCVGTLLSVYMALKGFGIYSFVLPSLLTSLCVLIYLLIRESPRFYLFLSPKILQFLGNRSIFHLLYGVLQEAFSRIDDIIISIYFGSSFLGLYRKAYNLGGQIHSQLGVIVAKITYPLQAGGVLAYQKELYLLSLQVNFLSIIIVSIVVPLVIYSDSIIRFLYGPQWDLAASYFKYFSPYLILWPIFHQLNSYVFAKNKIDICFKVYLCMFSFFCFFVFICGDSISITNIILCLDFILLVATSFLFVLVFKSIKKLLVLMAPGSLITIAILIGIFYVIQLCNCPSTYLYFYSCSHMLVH